jgi:hypothetical protein
VAPFIRIQSGATFIFSSQFFTIPRRLSETSPVKIEADIFFSVLHPKLASSEV